MPAIPWLLLTLLFLAFCLARALSPKGPTPAAAREARLRCRLAEMAVSLPKLPLPKPREKVYHRTTE